ncbi:MAG: hypothetical protein WC876_10810 [Candidatus Thermoplasmatota archaeon]|jgi:hypothetical protein
MRWLAAAALAAFLSGCVVPTDDSAVDPLFGLCPQWAQGPGAHTLGLHLQGNESQERELGPAEATVDDKPLDLYRIHLDRLDVSPGARTELRATAADGARLNLRDYRQTTSQLVPLVVFTDGSAAGHDFDVYLSSVAHDSAGSPAPVTLEWTQTGGETTVEATTTYHYKVCGAQL